MVEWQHFACVDEEGAGREESQKDLSFDYEPVPEAARGADMKERGRRGGGVPREVQGRGEGRHSLALAVAGGAASARSVALRAARAVFLS